ncbi:MAG TPA: EamA family transporter [Drouetiella sp.]
MLLNLVIAASIVCYGAWGIFDKKALESSNDRSVLLILYLVGLPEIPLLYYLCNASVPTWHVTGPIALWSGLASITSTLSLFAYLFAMSRAEASYVLGITASYPLVMQFLAFAFLGEKLVVGRLIGSALIGIGVTAVGNSAKHQTAMSQKDRLIVLLCIVFATFGWGVHGLFDKKAVELADPLVIFFTRSLFDAATLIVYVSVLKATKTAVVLNSKKAWLFAAFSAACLGFGYICYLKAMSLATASYVIVITGCYPLLMYIFALIFLKEKFNKIRFLGVVLVVAGGALVQLTQAQ